MLLADFRGVISEADRLGQYTDVIETRVSGLYHGYPDGCIRRIFFYTVFKRYKNAAVLDVYVACMYSVARLRTAVVVVRLKFVPGDLTPATMCVSRMIIGDVSTWSALA